MALDGSFVDGSCFAAYFEDCFAYFVACAAEGCCIQAACAAAAHGFAAYSEAHSAYFETQRCCNLGCSWAELDVGVVVEVVVGVVVEVVVELIVGV